MKTKPKPIDAAPDYGPIARAMEDGLNLLPVQMGSGGAVVLLWAIGLQESRMVHRYQVLEGRPGVKGPARGLLQFERGGGCAGVLTHHASRFWMHKVCEARGVKPTPHALWLALEHDDVLAFAAGRLLLFTDPKPLPHPEDAAGGWRYYIRNWRPGKPRPDKWPRNHARAIELAAMPVPA
jgi:hypothetical protein